MTGSLIERWKCRFFPLLFLMTEIYLRPQTHENIGFKGEQSQLFSHQRLDMKINNSHACTVNLGVQRAADQLS